MKCYTKKSLLALLLLVLLMSHFPGLLMVEKENPFSTTTIRSPNNVINMQTRNAANGTWTAIDSPHYINQTTTILANTTLVIEAGAEVFFTGNHTLIVEGKLVAQGNSSAGITFGSMGNSSTKDAHISINPQGTLNMSHCTISNLGGFVWKGEGYIQSSTFNNCTDPLIFLNTSNSGKTGLVNTTFHNSTNHDLRLNSSIIRTTDISGSNQSSISVVFDDDTSRLHQMVSYKLLVLKDTGEYLQGCDIRITNSTNTIYATAHFMGDDLQTDAQGEIGTITMLANTSGRNTNKAELANISLFHTTNHGVWNSSGNLIFLNNIVPGSILEFAVAEDIFPPLMPTELNISQVNNTAINISWAPGTSPDTTGHLVYISSGGNWTLVDNVTMPFNHTIYDGVEVGTNYSVKLCSFDDVFLNSQNTTTHIIGIQDMESPFILDWSPRGTNISRDCSIEVLFSESMDKDSVMANFYISISASITMANNNTLLKAVPYLPLDHNTTYYLKVVSGACDLAGNALGYNLSFNFTTELDLEGPRIISASPTGTEVETGDVIEFQFDESIDVTSFQNAFNITPAVPGTISSFDNGKLIWFDPSSALEHETLYSVTLSTLVKDLVGNNMDEPYHFSFTTVSRTDTTPPILENWGPVGNETSIYADIFLHFSEPMWVWSVFYAVNVTPHLEFVFESSDNQSWFTLHPLVPWAGSTLHTVSISPNAKDEEGNSIATSISFNFTTHEDTAPYVNQTYPTNDQKGVNVIAPIRFWFSEKVAMGDNLLVSIKPSVELSVIFNSVNNTLTVIPNSSLQPDTRYTVTLEGMQDSYHNTMVKFVLHFYTGSFIPVEPGPKVYLCNPPDGSIDVPLDIVFYVTFNNDVAGELMDDECFTLWKDNNTRITGTVSFQDGYMYLSPDHGLRHDTQYTCRISGVLSANDLTPMEKTFYFSFTTEKMVPQPTAIMVEKSFPTNASEINYVKDYIIIWFRFNTVMNFQTILGNIAINPQVSFNLRLEDSGHMLFVEILDDLMQETTYTVTISGEVEDINGTELGNDHILVLLTTSSRAEAENKGETWFRENQKEALGAGGLVVILVIIALVLFRPEKRGESVPGEVKCPHCGKPVMESDASCWSCWEELEGEKEEMAEVTEYHCPVCDALVSSDDGLCLTCGENLLDEEKLDLDDMTEFLHPETSMEVVEEMEEEGTREPDDKDRVKKVEGTEDDTEGVETKGVVGGKEGSENKGEVEGKEGSDNRGEVEGGEALGLADTEAEKTDMGETDEWGFLDDFIMEEGSD